MYEYWFDPEYWQREFEDETEQEQIDRAILDAFDELRSELEDRNINAYLWANMEGNDYDF